MQAATDTLAALRTGAGADAGLMLDINFNFKTEGFRRIADAVAPYDLTWLEVDTHDPASLALIRNRAPCPVASCETLCHRRDFKPYFKAYAMDVTIIDVIWNGLAESPKIGTMAEVYEVNVAPHNFYGYLATAMNAHFSAVVPNSRIMETDVDSVPWRDEFVTAVPLIEDQRAGAADRPRLGHRCQRSRSARAAAAQLTEDARRERRLAGGRIPPRVNTFM